MLRFSFKQQVFAGFAISVLLVLLVGVLSYKSIHQLESDSTMVEHTQKVIKTSTNLLQMMIDAETGMRGYVATNDKVYLDPYNEALPKINADLEQLRTLISDTSKQIKRLDSLTSFVNQQLIILKEDIDTRADNSIDFMIKNHMIIRGKHSMDEIRTLNDEINEGENHQLAVRKANSYAASTYALNIIIGGSVVFLIIIVVLFFYILGTFEQQKKIEKEIKITNSELEKVLEENRAKNWLLTGTALLNEKMQGQQSEKELAENILTEICSYAKALTGTFYLYNEDADALDLYASYAFNDPGCFKEISEIK